MKKRCVINKNFFKKWNADMAYILGFLYADGNIIYNNRGSRYFSLYSMDREILFKMRACMTSNHKISCRKNGQGSVYRIQIGSKDMVNDLKELGLNAAKTYRMKFPLMPDQYFPHFLRGYFDGDGNVWIGTIHKDRKIPTTVILSAFTCASTAFLTHLHNILKTKGIIGGSIFRIKGKNCGRLNLSIFDSLKLYEIMYTTGAVHNLFLQRKKLVFEQFLKMRV